MAIPRPDTRRPPKLPPQMRPFDDLDGLAASRMPAKPNTDRATTASPPKKPIQTREEVRDAQRRAAYEEEQAAQAGQNQGAQGGPADARDAQDKRMEAEYAKRKKASGGDDLDELARERQAASQEIDAQNARAAMDQRSRAGLGGLGLSGAASAAEGDLTRQQARSKILTMQQFDQAAEDAKFTGIQRQAALDDLEDAADIDYDGDGLIAGQTEGQRKQDQELQSVIPDKADEYVAGNKASAEEITAAEFKLLPAGGTGTFESDGYLYIITNETPRRFLKVKASAIGAGRSD